MSAFTSSCRVIEFLNVTSVVIHLQLLHLKKHKKAFYRLAPGFQPSSCLHLQFTCSCRVIEFLNVHFCLPTPASMVQDNDLVSYYSVWIGQSEVTGALQNNSKMWYRTRHSFGWPLAIACPLRGTRPWPIYWPFTTRRQLHRSWQTTAGRWPFASFPSICNISYHLQHFWPFASFPSICHNLIICHISYHLHNFIQFWSFHTTYVISYHMHHILPLPLHHILTQYYWDTLLEEN